jgi:hypothetical protein
VFFFMIIPLLVAMQYLGGDAGGAKRGAWKPAR